MRHFITLGCYGAHLHGDESGSVDRRHNRFGGRSVEADPQRTGAERRSMDQPPYEMDSESCAIVLQALAEVCSHRGWNLLAAHVRTHHVPVIVEAEVPPEKVMRVFKAYPSRALNRLDGKQPGRRRWARLWSSKASLWRFSWGTCPEARQPLAHARGSVTLNVAPRTDLA